MISSILSNLFPTKARDTSSNDKTSELQDENVAQHSHSDQAKRDPESPDIRRRRSSVYFPARIVSNQAADESDSRLSTDHPVAQFAEVIDLSMMTDSSCKGVSNPSFNTPPLPPLREAAKSRLNDASRKRQPLDGFAATESDTVDAAAQPSEKKARSGEKSRFSSLEEEDCPSTEPTSMHPEPLESKPPMFIKLPPRSMTRDPSQCSPVSPDRFDDVQMKSRAARAWNLVRPEDFTDATVEERRKEQYRTAETTLWTRALNNAVIEKDHKRVRELLVQAENRHIRSDSQFEKLLRCSTVLRDWKTLAVLLYFGNRHLESEREVVDACRDVIVFGTQTSPSDVAQQQTCMQLLMCSFGKLPRHNPKAFSRQLQVPDLVSFLRNDDVVSLAVGLMQFLETGRVNCGAEFCQLETATPIAPSRATEELPDDPDQEKQRERTIGDSYFTPQGTRRGDCSADMEEDDAITEYYTHVIVPRALNGRKATLVEFAAMIAAPHCTIFLGEVASGRLM